MPNTSMRQLDIFAHMAIAGSLARGAADMRLSVADVEKGLASLEMRLGYRLFDRNGDALRLTPAGQKTARAMALLSIDEEEAPPVPVMPARPIPVMSARTAILLAAPAAVFGQFQESLAAFEEANDDVAITLDLQDFLASDARAALEQGIADIVYFYALEAPVTIESRYGWSEQINLYAGATHRLARAEIVSRQDLCDEMMLAMDAGNPLRQLTDQGLRKAGVRPGPLAVETDNLFDIMTALREGMGCFAAFGPLARDLGKMEGIRRVALDIPLPAVEIRQAVTPRAADTAAIGALAEYLFL